MDDDGERYGGDRVLKVLNEIGAVDVLVVCARWFGGDMLGVSTDAETRPKDLAPWKPRRRKKHGSQGCGIGRRRSASHSFDG